MADLASSMTLWTPAQPATAAQSNALVIFDWATQQYLEARRIRENDFLRSLDRGIRPQLFTHHDGTTILLGPTDENVEILFARNAIGETVGARIQFAYPEPGILHSTGHAAAQVEARLLRQELPERLGQTHTRPVSRL